MAIQTQRRGGSTQEHENFIGANREITIDTDKKTVVVHDATQQGGFPLAREDLSNVETQRLIDKLAMEDIDVEAITDSLKARIHDEVKSRLFDTLKDHKAVLIHEFENSVMMAVENSVKAKIASVVNAGKDVVCFIKNEVLKEVNKVRLDLSSHTSRPGSAVKALMKGAQYGNLHTACFLMRDGSLRAVGRAYNYSNADNNNSHTYLPQTVPIDANAPPESPFKAVYQNYASFFALTESGKVYSWGRNEQGVLGHGNTNHYPYARCIDWFVDRGIQIREVICASNCVWSATSVYFITTSGELYACGYNGYGQLGNGTTTTSYLPVKCGNLSGVKQVSASTSKYTAVYAIDGNDDLWSWGRNSLGELGLSDTTHRSSPTKVTNLSNVKHIAAMGGDSTASGDNLHNRALALLHDGRVYGTGYNGYGELGVGDTTNRTSFTLLSGSLPEISQIYTGGGYYGYSGALDSDNRLWMWGANYYGSLGLGDSTNRSAPVCVEAAFQGHVDKVFLGGDYSYAQTVVLDNQGILWGCGYNGQGQLALSNTFASTHRFAKCKHPFPHIKIVDCAFAGHSDGGSLYALTEDGRVLSSGYNGYGQCGVQSCNLHRIDGLCTMLF